jgi:hypothetical protein
VPNVEEVKLHVSAAVDDAESAAQAILVVSDRLDQSLARLRLTTLGSVHPTAALALVRLQEAKAKLAEAYTLARGAMDAANEYRTTI